MRIPTSNRPDSIRLFYLLNTVPETDSTSQGAPIVDMTVDVFLEVLRYVFGFNASVI